MENYMTCNLCESEVTDGTTVCDECSVIIEEAISWQEYCDDYELEQQELRITNVEPSYDYMDDDSPLEA